LQFTHPERNLDVRMAIRATSLDQENAHALILSQSIGQDTAG